MAEVEVPFVDQEVDTSEPTSLVMTIFTIIAGGAIFFMATNYAQRLANSATNATDQLLGVESDDEIEVV